MENSYRQKTTRSQWVFRLIVYEKIKISVGDRSEGKDGVVNGYLFDRVKLPN